MFASLSSMCVSLIYRVNRKTLLWPPTTPLSFFAEGSIDSSYGHHALEYKYKDYTGQLIRGRGHRHVGVHESISLWPGFNDIK